MRDKVINYLGRGLLSRNTFEHKTTFLPGNWENE